VKDDEKPGPPPWRPTEVSATVPRDGPPSPATWPPGALPTGTVPPEARSAPLSATLPPAPHGPGGMVPHTGSMSVVPGFHGGTLPPGVFPSGFQGAPLFVPPRVGDIVRTPRGFGYAVLGVLSSGGFSTVYEGVDPFETPVAIKVFSPTATYVAVRERWFAEAALLRQLVHPNIVYIYDAFEYQGGFYLVLEKAEGNLGQYILGMPVLSSETVLSIAQQLLRALHFIHEHGVIHEDLHPGNILVFPGLIVKISDFGISRRLLGAEVRVAPETFHRKFVAPELASHGYTTPQSDLYHLGLILYALVTGQHAIDPALPDHEVSRLVLEGVPRQKAEALGTPLGQAIAKLLRRRQQYRYQSALEAWNDFRPLFPARRFPGT